MKTIGIIVAMQREITKLKTTISIKKEKQIENIIFYIGEYQDTEIIFTTAGIGKVNAAVTTILMIEHFKPELIINTGIAGGYDITLNPLDIVVANKVLYSDVDMTSEAAGNYPYGQIEGCPEYFTPNNSYLKDNEELHFGTILTGDQFVVDYDKTKEMVSEKFAKYDVIAFDMESGSIAQVCSMNQVDFVIIRAISDIIGSTNPFDYATFSVQAADLVASVVLNIIEKNK